MAGMPELDVMKKNKMIRTLRNIILVPALIIFLYLIARPFFGSTCHIDSPEITALRMKQTARYHVDHQFQTPLIAYRLDVGSYPSSTEGLNALMQPPTGKEDKWKGPYIEETRLDPWGNSMLLDPWGNSYQYRYPGLIDVRRYDIFSHGPDGVQSDDDICNWEEPRS